MHVTRSSGRLVSPSTGLSVTGTLYNPTHLAAELPDDVPIVFYIGAMASGHLTKAENPEVKLNTRDAQGRVAKSP